MSLIEGVNSFDCSNAEEGSAEASQNNNLPPQNSPSKHDPQAEKIAKEIFGHRESRQVASFLSIFLSILAAISKNAYIKAVISRALRTTADALENETIRHTVISYLKISASVVENDLVMDSLGNTLDISSQTMEKKVLSSTVETSTQLIVKNWKKFSRILILAYQSERVRNNVKVGMETIHSISSNESVQNLAMKTKDIATSVISHPITTNGACKVRNMVASTLANQQVQEAGGFLSDTIRKSQLLEYFAYGTESLFHTAGTVLGSSIVEGAFDTVSLYSDGVQSVLGSMRTETPKEKRIQDIRRRIAERVDHVDKLTLDEMLQGNESCRAELVEYIIGLEDRLREEKEAHNETKKFLAEVSEALANGFHRTSNVSLT